jgi:hypothetical protein
MEKKLTYEEILQNRSSNLPSVITETHPQLTLSGDATSLVEHAHQIVPQLQREMFANKDLLLGINEEEQQKWLSLSQEAMHAVRTVPKRRTMSEKRGSVLQANRHPTAASKFHQAKLEQAAYIGQYMDLTYSYKEGKIELEKLLYKRKKLEAKINDYQMTNKDSFLLEKKLELLDIKIVKATSSLNGCLDQAAEFRKEIEEWSILKQEAYQEAQNNNELWSPDEIDNVEGSQEIGLARRHLMNYLMLLNNGDNGDISSVLNIEGLCLTAIQEAVKSTKLGMILVALSDEQIDMIWQRIFGHKSEVNRTNMTITLRYGNQYMTFLTGATQFRELMKLRSNPEFIKNLLEQQTKVKIEREVKFNEEQIQVAQETDLAFENIVEKK